MSIEQHYTELNKFSIISKALTMKLFNFQVSWINIRNPLSSFLSFMFYKTQNVVLDIVSQTVYNVFSIEQS